MFIGPERGKRGESVHENGIEIQKRFRKMLLKTTREQLGVMGNALRELVRCVENEKPDFVIFLDKGSRPFASPIKQILTERGITNQPKISFFNDDDLKFAYLQNKSFEPFVEKFSKYKGKKVFFVDETYSQGKGAAALKLLADVILMDIHYFALTHDPNPENQWDAGFQFARQKEDHESIKKEIENDPRFTIYPYPIKKLFSRDTAELYVQEMIAGVTSVPVKKPSESNPFHLPSPYANAALMLGMDEETYRKKLFAEQMQTVREVKRLIVESLRDRA